MRNNWRSLVIRGTAVTVLCMTLKAGGTNAPATKTTAASRPSASQPASALEKRLNAELERAWKDVFPADIRNGTGKQEPTDEQKFLATVVRMLMTSAEATPERLAEAEKNRAGDPERIEALKKARASVRTKLAGSPEEVIIETEKALDAETEKFQIAQEVLDSPVTKGATQEQVELRTIEKIRDLPAKVRKGIIAGKAGKYHSARANLLGEIAALEKQAQAAGDESRRKALLERAAATRDLLKAVDARAAAEKRLVDLTPLGWLNNVGDE